MARIFITGSTDGLGRAAAQALIQESHQVVLHARSPERAASLDDLAPRSAGVVIGDLSSATDTRNVANQVNALGRMDAVIHNAGAYSTKADHRRQRATRPSLPSTPSRPMCSRR